MTVEQHPIRDVLIDDCNVTLKNIADSVTAYASAIAQLGKSVIPLPSSILTYWTTAYKRASARQHNLDVYMEFYPAEAPEELTETEAVNWYRAQLGIIAKTEQVLKEKTAFIVLKTVTAHEEREDIPEAPEACVTISAYLETASGIRDYSGPAWTFRFYRVDPAREPDASCHVEYERVELPARTIYRTKVVCEEPGSLPQEQGTVVDAGAQVEANT